MLKKINLSDIHFIYYALVFLAYFMTLFIPGLRVGVLAAALMVLIVIGLGLDVIKIGDIRNYGTLMNVSVLVYFIYNLISVIWVIKNGYPVSVFVEEFSNSVLPIVFYFAPILVHRFSNDHAKRRTKFYTYFVYAFVVFGMISVVFYLWAPQFYCDFLFNSSIISKADKPTARVRMESFMGSTTLSFLAVAAMIISSKYVEWNFKLVKLLKQLERFKKKYASSITSLVFFSLAFIFSLIVVFMANGRAGMVAAIFVIICLNIYAFFKQDSLPKKYFYIELGAIFALVVMIALLMPGIFHKVMARLVSLPGAVGQRSEQWIGAINNMYGQWFGNGLGVNGHKALNIEGAHVVADGGLIKLYCEEGALGFSLFLFIMLKLFVKGVKNLGDNLTELMILAVTLLMSIGSNIIAFQLCAPVFWYAAGILSYNTRQSAEKAFHIEDIHWEEVSRNRKYMRVMCMYLPQYHSFPENDEWWGEGYTEWTAVKRAKPLFKGHVQPRIPKDDRYYDLDNDGADTLRWQAGLAKKYGIYGFAFYHYYFKGKKLMYRPLEILLENPDIDIKFCLCWANETWTRTWYDLENEVLIKQEYGNEPDYKAHFDYLLRFFKDKRYIKIDNKPLFMIYKTADIDDLGLMRECFDKWAKEAGFSGIYIMSGKTADRLECRNELIDGYYYFEPGYTLKHDFKKCHELIYNSRVLISSVFNKFRKNKRIERVIPFKRIIDRIVEREYKANEFPGLIPDWDNTPRRSYKGLVYKGTSPETFRSALVTLKLKKHWSSNTKVYNDTANLSSGDLGFVFINAWNEWGEGAFIEPDEYRGYSYLEAIRDCVNNA